MQVQFPITVQAIRSKGCNPRLYVYVPLALAAAIGLEPGEQVQWTLLDRDTLQMKRFGQPLSRHQKASAKARQRKK
jgi:hypothetical protein